MGLTSLSLLLIGCSATTGVLVALAACWRLLGGRWLAVRIAGILLGEVLLLATVALGINRAGEFYPSWSALLGGALTRDLPHAPTANLSPWLLGKAKRGAQTGLVFTWKPAGEASWQLGEMPIVYLPPAYFRSATLSLPVITALAPARPAASGAASGALDDRAIKTLAPASAIPAVLVFLRTDRHLQLSRLAALLPARLTADLRVTSHDWGVIGIGSAIPAALELLRRDPVRFGPLALVPGGATPLNPALVRQAREAAHGQLLVAPGAVAPGAVAPGAVAPGAVGHRGSPGHGNGGLIVALRWAYEQLPPPLAPPLMAYSVVGAAVGDVVHSAPAGSARSADT